MHDHYQIQEALRPALDRAGFVVESDNPELDYCGSLRTIFVAGEKRILFEWDGEEGFGYAEVWKNGAWQRLATHVVEATEPEFQRTIDGLAAEIEAYL